MKLILSLFLMATATATRSLGAPKEALEERKLYDSHVYLPSGSGVWDECDYKQTVINTIGQTHSDHYCELATTYYQYHRIVTVQAVTGDKWDMQNELYCRYGRDTHYDTMLHCDHTIFRGSVVINMLCCSGDQYHYNSLDMAANLENATAPPTGSPV